MEKRNAYFIYAGTIYQVGGEYSDEIMEMEMEKGYIKDGFVYIYKGTHEQFNLELEQLKDVQTPVVFTNKYAKLEWVLPKDPAQQSNCSMDAISIVNTSDVIDTVINEMSTITAAETAEVCSGGEIFRPIINDNDDELTKVIKAAILEKNVCLQDYANKADTKHHVNNMKANLLGPKPMSVKYFMLWCELLGLGFEIRVTHGTDTLTSLTDDISVDNLGNMRRYRQSFLDDTSGDIYVPRVVDTVDDEGDIDDL